MFMLYIILFGLYLVTRDFLLHLQEDMLQIILNTVLQFHSLFIPVVVLLMYFQLAAVTAVI